MSPSWNYRDLRKNTKKKKNIILITRHRKIKKKNNELLYENGFWLIYVYIGDN